MTQSVTDIILESFAPPDPAAVPLYQTAQAEPFSVATDIDWRSPPVLPGAAARGPLRQILSQMFYADQAALHTCGQLIALMPDLAARFQLAAQALDEARHVEAVGRYLARIGGPIRLGPHMKSLFQALLATPNAEEKLVGVHVLLEGMTLDTCQVLLAGSPAPDGVLRQILTLLARDEARHMEATLSLVRRLFETGSPKRRRDAERALDSYTVDLVASTRWRSPELSRPQEAGTADGSVPSLVTPVSPVSPVSVELLRKNLGARLDQIGLRLSSRAV